MSSCSSAGKPASRNARFRRLLDQEIQRLSKLVDHPKSFLRLVHVVRSRSSILSSRAWPRDAHIDIVSFLVALVMANDLNKRYVRSPEQWIAPNGSPYRQLHSLVHHLFAIYPVPKFLLNSWFSLDRFHERDVALFCAIGQGVSLKEFPFDVQLNRLQRKWFMNAPERYSVDQAIRWAQVRAEGGDERLAKQLTQMLPFDCTRNEEFWTDVIRFFAQRQGDENLVPICEDELRSIVRFLNRLVCCPASEILDCELEGTMSLVPHFSLKGRTLKSIRRIMNDWRSAFAEEIAIRTFGHVVGRKWRSCGIKPHIHEDENGIRWTINELRSAEELRIEGAILRHCVGSSIYVRACKEGWSSVWSLRVWDKARCKRVVTIEINPYRRVVTEARGKSNCNPSEKARSIIDQWLQRESISA